jgi:hypothetical protein
MRVAAGLTGCVVATNTIVNSSEQRNTPLERESYNFVITSASSDPKEAEPNIAWTRSSSTPCARSWHRVPT